MLENGIEIFKFLSKLKLLDKLAMLGLADGANEGNELGADVSLVVGTEDGDEINSPAGLNVVTNDEVGSLIVSKSSKVGLSVVTNGEVITFVGFPVGLLDGRIVGLRVGTRLGTNVGLPISGTHASSYSHHAISVYPINNAASCCSGVNMYQSMLSVATSNSLSHAF